MHSAPRVYFYPHGYLRDFQLDRILEWPAERVVNPDLWKNKHRSDVTRERALGTKPRRSWKRLLPLIHLKRRPRGLPADVAVYVWGAIVTSGPFITDLENPYALTGYNVRALTLYRPVLRRLLLSPRCREIRCLSEACRKTLELTLGGDVAERARVRYPRLPRRVVPVLEAENNGCRFLFIGTQFELKGGPALLSAFRRVHASAPNASLDLVTHLPPRYASLARECPAIRVHDASYTREALFDRFFPQADVIVHPTYVESFGMVVLEALAHGLAIVATDVYALGEMVADGVNGKLVRPPVSIWDGFRPSRLLYELPRLRERLKSLDTTAFEEELAAAMLMLATNSNRLRAFRRESLRLFRERFDPGGGGSGF